MGIHTRAKPVEAKTSEIYLVTKYAVFIWEYTNKTQGHAGRGAQWLKKKIKSTSKISEKNFK